jgi:WD40 repeat protein
LLALANSGELFVYSLGPNTLSDRVDINPNPRHLVIDPQGQRAYVADDNGNLSIVSIAGTPFFVQDIATGGSLRGLDTTPAGQYLYATDRQLDNMKIVDLDQTHGTFRSVIENTPQVSNPADVAISNDGVYAFSGVARPRRHGTADWPSPPSVLGPHSEHVLDAGAPGTKVVLVLGLVGEDAGPSWSPSTASTTAEQLNLTTIIATVPNGARPGHGHLHANLSRLESRRNPMQFTVLGESSPNNIRFAGTLEKDPARTTCDYITPVIAFSPSGDYLYTGCGGTNEVDVYDIRPGSPNFHQMIGSFGDQTLPGDAVHDIALTADGKVAFIAGGEFDSADPREVQTIFADPNDPRFLTRGPAVPGPNLTTPLVSTSPNNRTALLLVNDGAGTIMVMNTGNIASGTPPSLADSTGLGANVVDIVHHPSSRVAYVGVENGFIRLFDTDPASANYGLAVSTIATGLTELWSLAVSSDGSMLYAYGFFFTDLYPYLIVPFDVSDPLNPVAQANCQTDLETIAPLKRSRSVWLRKGTSACARSRTWACSATTWTARCLRARARVGRHEFDRVARSRPTGRACTRPIRSARASGLRFRGRRGHGDCVRRRAAGVIDATLPVPRVRVTSSFPGTDLGGVPLTVLGRDRRLDHDQRRSRDDDDGRHRQRGFCGSRIEMGPSLGAQTVSVIGTGLVGSPLTSAKTRMRTRARFPCRSPSHPARRRPQHQPDDGTARDLQSRRRSDVDHGRVVLSARRRRAHRSRPSASPIPIARCR